jgi:hypothetical protein
MKRIMQTLGPGWLAATLVILSGCGAGGTPDPADPARAQEALRAVLDAWKAGDQPEDLEKRTPPIHVKDLDWRNGFHLVRYRADADGRLVGYDMNYLVVLELRSPKGNAVKRNALYTVTTRPQVLILRQEG